MISADGKSFLFRISVIYNVATGKMDGGEFVVYAGIIAGGATAPFRVDGGKLACTPTP